MERSVDNGDIIITNIEHYFVVSFGLIIQERNNYCNDEICRRLIRGLNIIIDIFKIYIIYISIHT